MGERIYYGKTNNPKYYSLYTKLIYTQDIKKNLTNYSIILYIKSTNKTVWCSADSWTWKIAGKSGTTKFKKVPGGEAIEIGRVTNLSFSHNNDGTTKEIPLHFSFTNTCPDLEWGTNKGSGSATFTFPKIDRTPPKISSITQNDITVKTASFHFNCSDTLDNVQYELNKSNNWNKISSSVRDFSITGLKPDSEYTIRVKGRKAKNSVWGYTSYYSFKTLKPEKPSGGKIIIKDLKEREVTLEVLDFIADSKTEITKYSFRIDNKTEQISNLSTYTFRELQPNTLYTCYVKAYDSFNTTSNEISISFVTKAKPTEIQKINVLDIYENGVKLHIDLIPSENNPMKEILWSVDGENFYKENYNTFEIRGLSSKTFYSLSFVVVSINNTRSSMVSTKILTKSKKPVIKNVIIKEIREETAYLEIITDMKDRDPISSFNLKIQDEEGEQSEQVFKEPNIMLTGLKPNTKYTITTIATDTNVISSLPYIITLTTSEDYWASLSIEGRAYKKVRIFLILGYSPYKLVEIKKSDKNII